MKTKVTKVTHLLATLTFEGAAQPAIQSERDKLERSLHDQLDERCLVTTVGCQIRIEIKGVFQKDQIHALACGVARVWEGEAA